MDMSKLPKLSQTPAPPSQSDPASPEQHNFVRPDYAAASAPAPAEAWVSIAMGVLLLLFFGRLIQYLLSPGTFDQKWTFSDPTGAPLAYTKTVFFWSDVALTAFAFVLIIDGVVLLFPRRRMLLILAFGLTVLTTLANVAYILATVQTYGPPLISSLAVIFGIYIALQQWRRIQSMQQMRAE